MPKPYHAAPQLIFTPCTKCGAIIQRDRKYITRAVCETCQKDNHLRLTQARRANLKAAKPGRKPYTRRAKSDQPAKTDLREHLYWGN